MLYQRLPDTMCWAERKFGLFGWRVKSWKCDLVTHLCVDEPSLSAMCGFNYSSIRGEGATVSGGACLCKMTLLVWRAKTTVHVHGLGVNIAIGMSKSGWMWSFCPFGLGDAYVEEHRSRDLSPEKWQLAGLVRLVSPLRLIRKCSLACIHAVFVLGNGAQMSCGTQLCWNDLSSK